MVATTHYRRRLSLYKRPPNVANAAEYYEMLAYEGDGTNGRVIPVNLDMTGGGVFWGRNADNPMRMETYNTERLSERLDFSIDDGYVTDLDAIQSVSASSLTVDNDWSTNRSSGTQSLHMFRADAEFFNYGTYAGNATSGRGIAHGLNYTPAFVFVKATSRVGDNWRAWHKSLNGGVNPEDYYLDPTAGAAKVDDSASNVVWSSTPFDSTNFYVGTDDTTNGSGISYEWFAFADNPLLVAAGRYAGDDSLTQAITGFGWQPGWLMLKAEDKTDGFILADETKGLGIVGSGTTTTETHFLDSDGQMTTNSSRQFTFDTDGFTVGTTDAINYQQVNELGENYLYLALKSYS